MKKLAFLAAFVSLLPLMGMVLAQTAPEPFFTVARQFGKLRPQGIQYDPNFDRLVMVDLQGQMLLADAATYQTQAILYKGGAYNSTTFSHDGRYLAVAIELRVDVWDTQTGKLNASFAPDGAKQVTAPLYFTPDDSFLLINTVVPAPQSTRRSENDTVNLPWLWDLPAARDEARSRLPDLVTALPFFSFRNGLVIGANDYLVAGLPARLQVINGGDKTLPVVSEIDSTRLERDPIYVWRSLTDDMLYVDPQVQNQLVQVDTQRGTTFNVPLGRDLNYRNLDQMQGLKLSNMARLLGKPNTVRENSFLRLLFGDNYPQFQNYEPLTVILLDILQPLTLPDDQMGLLVYTFNEQAGRGAIEFLRPQDIQQMVLHPDRTRLMVRRASGLQPIEVYNLDTGVLEKSYFPAEPDNDGKHVLAYNQTGEVIISDFQRFDAKTGEVLFQDVGYTAGFNQYYFAQDSQSLITINDTDWRQWDIASGDIVNRVRVNLRGSVIDMTPDAQRFLTQYNDGNDVVMEIMDVAMDERHSLRIPNFVGGGIEQIIPSADWQNYLVVYGETPASQHYPGNTIAVYNMVRGKLLFIAGDDLPQPEGRQYGWVDDQTIYIRSDNPRGHSQPERVYGIDYHPSGLPNCLVQAFPNDWQRWLPVWEWLNLNQRSDELAHLTQRLCGALPKSADQVVKALTPTPPYSYRAGATVAPLAIAGVPVCLTQRFRRESLNYAQLWREMSVGLSDDEKQQLEEMLCEGLGGGIAPTPTVDPNQINPPTPTPLPQAPVSVDQGNTGQFVVMTININTQIRLVGDYVPVTSKPVRNLRLVLNLFQTTMGFSADNPVLSPDGNWLATSDPNGFIVIYRLVKSYDQLELDEANAAATRQAEAPNVIGLDATATLGFEYMGQPRPTLTVTVTPTPPPLVEQVVDQAQYGQVQEFCPSATLYDVSAPPPGYAAAGRLFVPPADNSIETVWVLNPKTGELHPDETLPTCNLYENCTFSFDQNWVIRQNEAIIVSRPDGSDATVLFKPEERPVFPTNIYWLNEHTLEYTYQGYVPDRSPNPVQLFQRFDPVTKQFSEPYSQSDMDLTVRRSLDPQATLVPAQFLFDPNIAVYELPTDILSIQPGESRFVLVTTPYNGVFGGAKYYIYDRQTRTAEYFARLEGIGLEQVWHPLGRALYYRLMVEGDTQWYIFDPQTRQHRVLGTLPTGTWSRDGRYVVNWELELQQEEQLKRLAVHQRLPKITVWDSQTGLTRRYCIPETGLQLYSGPFQWSPDNRYLAFTIQLPHDGDYVIENFSTGTPAPTSTPVSLEIQYQLQDPRMVVLDTETGTITVISKEVRDILLWTHDQGEVMK